MEEYYDNVYINVLHYCAGRGDVSEAEVQYECGLSYDTVGRCFARMCAEKCVKKGEGDLYEVSISTDALFEPACVKKRMTELVKSLDEESLREFCERLGITGIGSITYKPWERLDRKSKAITALRDIYVLNDTGEGTELTLNEEERLLARKVLLGICPYAGIGADDSVDNGNPCDDEYEDESDYEDEDEPDDEDEDEPYYEDEDEPDYEDEDEPDDEDEDEPDDEYEEEPGDEYEEEPDYEDEDEPDDEEEDCGEDFDKEYFEKLLARYKRELYEKEFDLFGISEDDKDKHSGALTDVLIGKRRAAMLKSLEEKAAEGLISDDNSQAKKQEEQVSAEIRDILNNSDASRHTADSEETFIYKSLSDMTAIYKKLAADIREIVENDKRGVWDNDSEEFRFRQIYVSLGDEINYIATKALPPAEELKKEALACGSADDYASRFAGKVACMVLAYMNDYAYVRKGYKRFDDIFVYYKALYVLFNSAFVWEFSPEGKEAEASCELFANLKASISDATIRAGIAFYEESCSCDGEKLRRFNSRVYRDIFRFTVEMFAEKAAKTVLRRLMNADEDYD